MNKRTDGPIPTNMPVARMNWASTGLAGPGRPAGRSNRPGNCAAGQKDEETAKKPPYDPLGDLKQWNQAPPVCGALFIWAGTN